MADQEAAAWTEQVRLLFDDKAATWAAKYAPDGRLVGRLTHLADAAAFHVPADGRVLDLGCGTGELARHLAAGGLRMTGGDISGEMLARAVAADLTGSIEWVQLRADWTVLPFEAATFDAIVATSVLEYVRSPAAVLSECSRLLRPGGIMLCTVPDVSHPVRWMESVLAIAARLPRADTASRHCPALTRYVAYLRLSRQRRTARWWSDTAAHAELAMLPLRDGRGQHSTLRLLIFKRAGHSLEDMWLPS